MAIYVYYCIECKEVIELFQPMGAVVPGVCPKCSSKGTLRKKLTSFNFDMGSMV